MPLVLTTKGRSTLARGAAVAWISTVITAMYGVAWVIHSAAIPGLLPAVAKVTHTSVMLILPFGHLVGWWLLTKSLPGRQDNSSMWLLRVPLRGLLLVTTAAFVAPSAFVLWAGRFPAWLTPALLIVWTVLITLTCIAQMMYVRWLADILSDRYLGRIAGVFSALGPFLMVTAILSAGIGPLVVMIAFWIILARVRKGVADLDG